MNIIEFLEARIAEDEASVQNRADMPPHQIHQADVFGAYNERCPDCRGLPGVERTLAECAAKREILKVHGRLAGEPWQTWRHKYCATCADWEDDQIGEGPPNIEYPCDTLKVVAAVYKDHPDYQQEWAA